MTLFEFAKFALLSGLRCRPLLTFRQIVRTVVYTDVNKCFTFKYINTMPPKRKTAATKAREAVEIPDSTENEIQDDPPAKKNGRGKATAKPKKQEVEKTEAEDVETGNLVATRKRRQITTSEDAKNQQVDAEKPKTSTATTKRTKAKELKQKEDDAEAMETDVATTRKRPAARASKKEEDDKIEEKTEKAKKEKKPAVTKKAKETKETDENGDAEKPKKAKGRPAKPKAEASTSKEEPAPALMNQTNTSWQDTDFDCKKPNKKGEMYNTKIVSWNVDGLRAWVKKGCHKIMDHAKPDIICLQETKCNENQVPEEFVDALKDYKHYWEGSDKDGYAGVALISKTEPINVSYGTGDSSFDEEGRCITAEYEDFYLVGVYVPNAGRKLVTLDKRLEWNDTFKAYVKELDDKKPVILCGDMNVAHGEIDLANPKTNTKSAGFTKEEREGMTEFLGEGYVDTYRELYPDKEKVYTFWTYLNKARSKNVGWRLDYFIVSERIMENVCDNVVNNNVFGSDHCPITLFINI